MNVIFHQEVMTFCFVMGEKALRVGQRSLGHTPSCGYMERWGRGVGVRREGWEGGWEGEEGGETGGQLDEDGRKHVRINTAYMLKSSGFSTLNVSLNSFFEEE